VGCFVVVSCAEIAARLSPVTRAVSSRLASLSRAFPAAAITATRPWPGFTPLRRREAAVGEKCRSSSADVNAVQMSKCDCAVSLTLLAAGITADRLQIGCCGLDAYCCQ